MNVPEVCTERRSSRLMKHILSTGLVIDSLAFVLRVLPVRRRRRRSNTAPDDRQREQVCPLFLRPALACDLSPLGDEYDGVSRTRRAVAGRTNSHLALHPRTRHRIRPNSDLGLDEEPGVGRESRCPVCSSDDRLGDVLSAAEVLHTVPPNRLPGGLDLEPSCGRTIVLDPDDEVHPAATRSGPSTSLVGTRGVVDVVTHVGAGPQPKETIRGTEIRWWRGWARWWQGLRQSRSGCSENNRGRGEDRR